jgi:heme exporter protein B
MGSVLAALVWKELRIEWRARARVNGSLFFALLVLLLFSLAMGPETMLLRRTAAGFVWLALLLASVSALTESMRVEDESGAMEGLLLLPVPAAAIFLSKAAMNALFMLALSAVLVPVSVALFDLTVASLPRLSLTLGLGAFAIAAPGTLYAALAAQARARDVLLPLLLFPVWVPCLVACVRATALSLEGDPMGQFGGWAALLLCFAGIYWILGALLFRRVVD